VKILKGLILFYALDLFKDLIIQNIKLVKLEIIKSKKSIEKIQEFKLTVPQILYFMFIKTTQLQNQQPNELHNIAELYKTNFWNFIMHYNKLQGTLSEPK
jgi:hypothetical protein